MHLTDPSQITQERTRLERLGLVTKQWAGLIGGGVLLCTFLVSFGVGDGLEGMERFFRSYLVNFMYFLSLSLGALFFIALQHLTRAGWSVVVRRIAEFTAAAIPLFVILFIPFLGGIAKLYPWTHADMVQNDPVLLAKGAYLNVAFFLARCVLYFAVWWSITRYFLTRSLQQDESGDVKISLQLEKVSAPAMILFAFTLTFASFDWMMSLEPHWYSTIYGVYYFGGCVIGFLSFLIVLSWLLQSSGRLVHAITIEHYHDMGKLLFAFIFFWGYIAFSQYLLIWYGNIPEETIYYLRRQEGSWLWVTLILLFGHFVIPFAGLLSRYPKRRKRLLVIWAIWMLIMHWIDLYWLVMPSFSQGHVSLSFFDLGCFIGMGGLFIAFLAGIARGHSLIPLKDPRLGESLTFENA